MATVIAAWSIASIALGAGPASFSNMDPALDGFTTQTRPTVRVSVYDPAGVSSASLRIDGSSVGTYWIHYPIGHWVDPDGCGAVWVVDDYRSAVLSFQPSTPLTYGPHTAQAAVTNGSGVTSTHDWAFTVDAIPVISSVVPAENGVARSLTPTIAVTVIDDDDEPGILMAVDGVAVVPAWNQATRTYSYVPILPMQDLSAHSVHVTVTDSRGSVATKAWTFTAVSSPTGAAVAFSDRRPASGAVVSATTLNLGIRADSAGAGFTVANSTSPAPSKLFFDGAPLATGIDFPVGHWIGDPACDAEWVLDDPTVMTMAATVTGAQDGTHTVKAYVVDDDGESAETTWPVRVAVPPTADRFQPATGTSADRPEISARVTDNGGTPTVRMLLDGTEVASSFDPMTGVVSYTPDSPVSDPATHTVTLEMVDAAGNTSTASWSFYVDSASKAIFSNRQPGAGALISYASTGISVEASGSMPLHVGKSRIHVDGQAKTTYTAFMGSNRYRISANAEAYTDGAHAVRVYVENSIGISSETTWTFNVAAPPTISSPVPSPGTTSPSPSQVVSFKMADNSAGPLRARLTVDGSMVLDEVLPQGVVTWSPTVPYLNNTTHSVTAAVTDAVGKTATYSWTFRVVAAPPMSTGSQCTTCHDVAAHPFDDCYGCHVNDPNTDPHMSNLGPTGDICHGCHGWQNTHSAVVQNCLSCHGVWPWITRHTDASITASHSSALPVGCDRCHDTSLVSEHGKYPAGYDFKYQCDVCHTNTDATVQSAITGGTTECSSCHGAVDHATSHVSPTSGTCFGSGCHPSTKNLVDVHARFVGPGSANPEFADTCALCHLNSAVDPAAAGMACTPGCHSATTHAEYASSHTPTAASAECTVCHTGELSTVHGANPATGTGCDTCHAREGNWSKTAECDQCHPGESHITVHESTLDSGCTGCHAPNLVAEHLERHGLTCASCHDAQAPAAPAAMGIASFEVGIAAADLGSIDDAIANGDTSCGACHDVASHPVVDASWNRTRPYYRWDTRGGGGEGPVLSSIGDNPTKPGVHANYTANTAKCGICHSVHRATAGGIKLLDTAVATCAGCHQAGATTVTNVVVTWESGGPHGSGTAASCNTRGCHVDNPHGANGSAYAAFSSKLLTRAVDAVVAPAASAPASSGVTASVLDGTDGNTGAVSALRTGYTCNVPTCHGQTMLAVLQKGWSEDRQVDYVEGNTTTDIVAKTGHPTIGASNAYSFAPVTDCESCHDQTDGATRTGFTFPHSQTPRGTSNTSVRSYLWMTVADRLGGGVGAMTDTDDKPKDGACLKCHRLDAVTGVGASF